MNYYEEMEHAGGREAGMDAQYDFQAEEERRERALWGGRIPRKPTTYHCGDCGTRNINYPMHELTCPNYRGR